MDMRRLVGRNVKRIRLEKGLTQEQFAERSGFTQQYLSDLERGRRNPTIVSLFELAQALGVDHMALVAPDEEAFAEKARHRKAETKPAPRKSERPRSAKSAADKNVKPDRRKG
ncbi:MAG: XRE family transcriptional regulator [Methylocystaceae bacterium]|nr:MAG: XRE family transcriptional regulator [Methylocystaceae bacterium]